jgi:DNA (cytosine-5)-methyltransferase 1
MGYGRAGFEVVGVDIRPQPRYPFEFVQAEALTFLRGLLEDHTAAGLALWHFQAIHASPPCQFFTQMRASWRAQGVNDGYVDLLTPTLAMVRHSGLPYVVENVVGARKAMRETLMLHGGMFGLAVHRPRVFETSFLVLAPPAAIVKEPVGVYDTRPRGKTHHRTRLNGNGKGRSEMRIARTLEEGQEAMGIDWMEWSELKEAIPPAYTELIGHQLLQHLAFSGVAAAKETA